MSGSQFLHGKGIWARPRTDGTSELDRAIDIARRVGGTHVLYKVASGTTYFEGAAQAAHSILAAGLEPFAWTSLKLDDPAVEAQGIARAFRDGYRGMVLDVKPPACRHKSAQARQLAEALRAAGLDPGLLYNHSFPNILAHQDLPYAELAEICQGGLMPMAFGIFFAPGDATSWEDQARKVIDDWAYDHAERWCATRPGDDFPVYPVLGPYHDAAGNVRMRADEFQVWLDRLEDHGPSFFSVYTAAVIDDALLPPIRNLSLSEPVEEHEEEEEEEEEEGEQPVETPPVVPPPPPPPETAKVWVRPLAGTVILTSAGPASHQLEAVIYGAALDVKGRIAGADGVTRLQVLTPNHRLGWVPEDQVSATDPGPPPSLPDPPPPPTGQLTHVWTRQELNFRDQPGVRPGTLIGRLYPGARLKILTDPVQAKKNLGKHDQWFNVQLEPDGPQGWIAAWYVIGPQEPASSTHVRVYSDIGLNVRMAPSTSAPKVWHVPNGTILELKDPQDAAKVGKQGQWVQVRAPSLHEGYAAAWYLRADVQPDNRRPVSDASLPKGESAWLFGIHAAGSEDPVDFRHLFHGSGRTGWILFTETIGTDPAGLQPNPQRRQKLWDWAQAGYGMIIRLNNAYEPSGTLPRSAQYRGFAAACARYAELFLKHPEVNAESYTWVIVIGNEQNNPREWPGANEPSAEPITPGRYATAFNLAYTAIKNVLPNATVVTGAVDPYNAALQRPLDYFAEMLKRIKKLDGFALHTYTHGPHVELVTKLTKFTNDPIKDHYYDFQAYRPFAEAIPPHWRSRPIYITESNHWTKSDGNIGWDNRNIGWIRAAYAEVNRWNNSTPAHQIRALMIYRWLGDQWAIQHLDQVHADFRAALGNDYRWRR